MIWRRGHERADLTEAAQHTDASRRQAEEEMAHARAKSAVDQGLAEELAELNASNGFVQLMVDAVVRGSK